MGNKPKRGVRCGRYVLTQNQILLIMKLKNSHRISETLGISSTLNSLLDENNEREQENGKLKNNSAESSDR